MKKVYLIRHAKSSWKDITLDDFQRPLNKRGKMNAPFMAQQLKAQEKFPDIILASPAKRAKQTAEIFANELRCEKNIIYNQALYEASVDTLHKLIVSAGFTASTLFLIAHNPALNSLASKYVALHENIPTSGVVEIRFLCEKWTEIRAENAELLSFNYPKKEHIQFSNL